MTDGDTTESEVADLVRRCADAAAAFIRGDMRTYLELITHADDYTLLAPFGGEPRHGFDSSDEALQGMAQYFTGGEAEVELNRPGESGDFLA